MSVATPALPVRTERLWAALLAATLMNLPLGSVYAFSVLLRPIEQELGIPRSALSLVFGLATVGFTVGSVGAAFLYRVAPAPILVLASALVAAGGIATAAMATGLAQLLLGYGIVFGTGGGVSYILLQQGVNMLVRRRQGLVNGYIVSLYPMGAMIATPAFHACNEAFGWRTTLGGLATVLVACGIAAALLARHGGARLVAPKSSEDTQPATLGLTFFKLSATFFLAASAGLMVLSQAREIVAA
jgi:OFA family oxalate/formate antiporter-like MFS transporter